MKSRLPQELNRILARLRRDAGVSAGKDDLFEIVLQLAEYVAGHEDLVRARERELEPDALARKIFADPETIGIRAIRSLLAKLTRQDLAKLERSLRLLEKRHGRALETPPNHRLLVDGAVLGQVGFIYNRKFQEILATRTLEPGAKALGLLADLVSRVDELFVNGRPRYLWRLGPEFGVHRNVNLLLDRGDDFIVRSIYRSRAERLARGVPHWQELPGELCIGENCDDLYYRQPVRNLVVRSTCGRRTEFSLLVTNLVNTPWEDVYRFYKNRSGKLASLVEVTSSRGGQLRRAISASIVIIALFTFRNARSWAGSSSTEAAHRDRIAVRAAEEQKVRIYESRKRAEFLDRMHEVASYVQELTGGTRRLEGLTASLQPAGYEIRLAQESEVPVLRSGQVIFVDREGTGDSGKSVVVYHGLGFTTVYSRLGSISDTLRVGAMIADGERIGRTGDSGSPLHLEAKLARRYAEKGFEPTASDILSADGSMVLDPIGVLVELDSGRGPTGQGTARDDETPRMPSFNEVDLFLLEDTDISAGILFLAANVDERSSLIADPLDEDLAQIIGEALEDIS